MTHRVTRPHDSYERAFVKTTRNHEPFLHLD